MDHPLITVILKNEKHTRRTQRGLRVVGLPMGDDKRERDARMGRKLQNMFLRNDRL